MISSNDIYAELRVRAAPNCKRIQKAVAIVSGCMNEIPEHDESLAVVSFDQVSKALKIFDRRTARQGNSSTPEHIVLAEVRISDHQRALRGPNQRSIRMQKYPFTLQLDFERSARG
jgi:hypothetical protein